MWCRNVREPFDVYISDGVMARVVSVLPLPHSLNWNRNNTASLDQSQQNMNPLADRALEELHQFCIYIDKLRKSKDLQLDYKAATDITDNQQEVRIRLVWFPPKEEFAGSDKYVLKKSKFRVRSEYSLQAFELFLRHELEWVKDFVPNYDSDEDCEADEAGSGTLCFENPTLVGEDIDIE